MNGFTGYKEQVLEIMWDDRNIIPNRLEATFYVMKEIHMKNGQLNKAAYNVQIGSRCFIVQAYVSNDRQIIILLIPVLEKHKNAFGEI